MKRANLELAWSWWCPDCEHRNYLPQEGMTEVKGQERDSVLRQMMDLEPWQELPDDTARGSMVTTPDEVRCARCQQLFTTVISDDDADSSKQADQPQ